MRDRINDSPSTYLHRSSAWLVGGFAALALLLSVVGLYGVVAYSCAFGWLAHSRHSKTRLFTEDTPLTCL